MGKKIKYYGDGIWIDDGVSVKTPEEADIIIMPGGDDWNPKLYNHAAISETTWDDRTDLEEMSLMDRAIKAGKAIFGICRGIQGLTIKAGGSLIQDVHHPNEHLVKAYDGSKYVMNSCHHQMCNPYDLPEGDYEVLAWTEEISPYHIMQDDEQLVFPDSALDDEGWFKEPEVIHYPKINALGSQGHPEWYPPQEALNFLNRLLREKLSF